MKKSLPGWVVFVVIFLALAGAGTALYIQYKRNMPPPVVAPASTELDELMLKNSNRTITPDERKRMLQLKARGQAMGN